MWLKHNHGTMLQGKEGTSTAMNKVSDFEDEFDLAIYEKPKFTPESLPRIPRIGILPRYNDEHTQLTVGLGYINGVLNAGGIPLILPSSDDPALLDAIVEGYDGFLIPGGHDVDPAVYGHERERACNDPCPERDAMEYALVPRIVAADKPLFGICRGSQIINVAMGGTLVQDIPTAVPRSLQHDQIYPYDEAVHTVDIVPNSKLASIMLVGHTAVNSIHHQQVDEVGEGVVVTAHAKDGVVEAIEMPDKRFVIGVQWHPEYMWPQSVPQRRLFRAFVQEAARSKQG